MSLHSIFSSSKLHPFAISGRPFFSKLFAFFRFRQPYFSVVQPGFPRIHTSLPLTIQPETLENIEFNRILTCHPVHSVV